MLTKIGPKGWGVYVDMSAFEDYELLFDIVKSQTKMFVAYLTQDFWRVFLMRI